MKRTLNNTASTYFNAYVPVFLWTLIIFVLSSQETLPSFETSTFDFIFKKCAHMGMYAALYLLLVRATRRTLPNHSPAQLWFPLIFVTLYAISDELHQQFVPGRYGTIRDVGYDLLGAMIVFMRQYRYI